MNRSVESFLRNIAYSPSGNKLVSLFGGRKLYTKWRVRSEKKKLLANAKKEFEKGSSLGSFEDYKLALEKHWVSYTEYTKQYEFYKKTEEERDEYISRLKMASFYWSYSSAAAKSVNRKGKQGFLTKFYKNVHRKWLYVPEASFEEFEQMVSNYDCIAKPYDGKLGNGIFKIYKDEHKNTRQLFDACVKDKILVEECIEECEELKAFHPQSLNTLRVVTISNKEKATVFSGVFRTGVGDSVVDNTHKGGVSVQIDVKTGVVETDGANTRGERFVCHPDSGIAFKGFRIPQWDNIINTCCEAAKIYGNPITGWDVVVNRQGEVEFVEANCGPDMDMMQTRYNAGAKKRIYALIKEYCGIEMK